MITAEVDLRCSLVQHVLRGSGPAQAPPIKPGWRVVELLNCTREKQLEEWNQLTGNHTEDCEGHFNEEAIDGWRESELLLQMAEKGNFLSLKQTSPVQSAHYDIICNRAVWAASYTNTLYLLLFANILLKTTNTLRRVETKYDVQIQITACAPCTCAVFLYWCT